MITLQKQNIELSKEEINDLLECLNEEYYFFKNRRNEKKKVSFYDDDNNCYLILNIPVIKDFDCEILDLFDYLSCIYGVTNCKYDGEFLC